VALSATGILTWFSRCFITNHTDVWCAVVAPAGDCIGAERLPALCPDCVTSVAVIDSVEQPDSASCSPALALD
jgi:hypothetical protein